MSPSIFISYRQSDSAGHAAQLKHRLCEWFDADDIFFDLRSIEPGDGLRERIESAINAARAILVVVGPDWLQPFEAGGGKPARLDWVSLEIELALKRQSEAEPPLLLPILVGKSELPNANDPRLPDAIRAFIGNRALRLQGDEAEYDHNFERLIGLLAAQAGVPKPRHRSAAARPPEPRVSLSRLPLTRTELFGRQNELALLDACVTDRDVRVLSLIAWGGVGKSALINHWLQQLARERYRGAGAVFGWSFYSQGTTHKTVSADLFMEEALRWFGDPEPTRGLDFDKATRLAKLMRDQNALIVLDGLEPLQRPPGNFEGEIKDQARSLRYLLIELATSHTGLCVISSRLKVADLERRPGTQRRDLQELAPEAGAQLLRSTGVTGDEPELRQASIEFAGHALALTLLGGYLTDACDGDVRRRGEVAALQNDQRMGEHARRVMKSYEDWFGPGPEVSVLRMLGLFDRPASGDAIRALREPGIAGLSDALGGLGQARWKQTLANLRRASLLAPLDADNPDVLDAHPLIREHFAQQLVEHHPEAWKQGHERLYLYSRENGVELPETIDQMTPYFEAVVHACEAGMHREALRLYRDKVLRGNEFYSTYKLGAFGNEMALLHHFFEGEWDEPVGLLDDAEKAFVLHQVGYCQRARGILKEAALWLEKALAAYAALDDRVQRLNVSALLSAIYLLLGELKKALAHATHSVELSDTLARQYDMWVNRTKLGDIYHQSGDLERARAAFEEAEAILRRQKPTWFLYGYSGFKFMDLLLTMRQFDEVRRRGHWVLEWVASNPVDPSATNVTSALANLALGHCALADKRLGTGNTLDEARHCFELAFDHLHQADRQELLVLGWLARAELARVEGDLERAGSSLGAARAIADRGAMKLRKVDCLLEHVRLQLALSEATNAAATLKEAAELIRALRYGRRHAELTELQTLVAAR